jgi:hypothetical protein
VARFPPHRRDGYRVPPGVEVAARAFSGISNTRRMLWLCLARPEELEWRRHPGLREEADRTALPDDPEELHSRYVEAPVG